MLIDFITKKLASARFKRLKDKTYFGEIPGLKGVWANAKTLKACRAELQEVLENWLVLKIRTEDKIPGLDVHGTRRAHLVNG